MKRSGAGDVRFVSDKVELISSLGVRHARVRQHAEKKRDVAAVQ